MVNPLPDHETIRALASSMGYYVDSIEGLRQHHNPDSGQIFLRGYDKPGDGAEGLFIWQADNAEMDDGGVLIAPSGADLSNKQQSGRWVRMTRGQSVSPLWWGAKFDNANDDTDAIQAAINFATRTGGDVLMPPGIAKITRTLFLRAPDKLLLSGFSFKGHGTFGDIHSSISSGSGTLLLYYGSEDSVDAILQVEPTLRRFTTISDLSLMANTAFGAKFGLVFNSTEFTGQYVTRVSVENTRTAFAILKGTGANGEFTYFSNCTAANVQTFFYNNSGQAYVQRFDHCGSLLLAGGTYFHMDIVSGVSPGGGLVVTDFNATGLHEKPGIPTNTTLLRTGENISPISFFGGRIEHLTRLVELAPNFIGVSLSIQNMELTVDSTQSPQVLSFIKNADNAAMIAVNACRFEGLGPQACIVIDSSECDGYGGRMTFSNCSFGGFIANPKSIIARHNTMSAIKFVDCSIALHFTMPLKGGRLTNGHKQPLSLEWAAPQAIEALRSRRLQSPSALAVSGRPANMLIMPAFSEFKDPGSLMSGPAAPWKLQGNVLGFRISQVNAPDDPGGAPAWSRIISLDAGTKVFQDLTEPDLASPVGLTTFFYAPVHELYYQALYRYISGQGTLRIAVENNVTGEVYDEQILSSKLDRASGPHLLSLVARVPPLIQSSTFRIILENMSDKHKLTLNLAWQFASPQLDASFVGIEGVPALKEDWALSAESLRAWDRFMLPYKRDIFGAKAPRPLRDLYSDQYVSVDDGRLTYFGGDVWCKVPRTQFDNKAPTDGLWRLGDQILNQTPKSGNYIGWVCVAAGAPGEWRPFGRIE